MERKIRQNIYILIGLSVLALAGMVLGWFFVLVRPQRDKIEKTQASYDADSLQAKKLKKDLSDEKQAMDNARYLKGQLAYFRRRFNSFSFPELPPAVGATAADQQKRIDAWRRYMRLYYGDQTGSGFGDYLLEVITEAKDKATDPVTRTLTVDTGIKVDAPYTMPEQLTIPANGLLKPSSADKGGVLNLKVTGSLKEIKDFLANINRSPILMVVGSITDLKGTAPAGLVTVTLTVTPYVLAVGPGVDNPAAGGGAAAAATPATATPGAGVTPGGTGGAAAPTPPVTPPTGSGA